MSSIFSQIRPLTVELAVLDLQWLSCGERSLPFGLLACYSCFCVMFICNFNYFLFRFENRNLTVKVPGPGHCLYLL